MRAASPTNTELKASFVPNFVTAIVPGASPSIADIDNIGINVGRSIIGRLHCVV